MTQRRLQYRLIAFVVLGAGLIPADAVAQDRPTSDATLTGTWEIAEETRGRRGRSEVLTLRQNADGTLTGAFIVEALRSEEPIQEGLVDQGSFSFTRDRIQARYEGTIDGDEIRGTMT